MAEERDPQQQKWENLVSEGVDNHFKIGSLRQMETNDDEPSETTTYHQPFLDWPPAPIPKECGNSSGIFSLSDIMSPTSFPLYCKVNQTQITRDNFGKLRCLCYVHTRPNYLNEYCCQHECCKEFTTLANVSPLLNTTELMEEKIGILIETNLTGLAFPMPKTTRMVLTSMTTTEMVSIDIPHSTTTPNSGSAPTRRHQDLALVAAAVLIYIHRRGPANFL